MDGTPHLLTDVKFSERRRGYDPDEVDNFLERVSAAVAQLQDKLRQATARAEEADARVLEADRARALAESEMTRLQESGAGAPPPVDPTAGADAAAKVLALAQQTADQVVADANQTANATLDDSRTRAGAMVADAEREAGQVLGDARRKADELVAERQRSIADEVRSLEGLREQLNDDVRILNRHLDGQRASIRAAVAQLQELLDDPAAFRPAPVPPTSGAALSADLDEGRPSPVVVGGDAPTAETPAVIAGSSAPEVAHGDVADEAPGPVADEAPAPVADEVRDESPAEPTPAATDVVEPPEAGGQAVSSAAPAETPTIDLSDQVSPPPSPSPAPGGADTQLFAPFDDQAAPPSRPAPLGEPDADADEAMRAFFEADFDESRERPRFGRRR